MEWLDNNRIQITPPKKPKKLTGTRFASILGLNPWSTPFEIWCAVTRTYEKPFEGTIYTEAGKTIEPKQAEYMKQTYFWKQIISPAEVWGENYFEQTFGDFFPESPVCGGMWDFLVVDKEGRPIEVLEMKTTKRIEDWEDGVPEYYALQAALYAYLLGVDDVTMVASFLEEADYACPERFHCDRSNTITRRFKVSQRYPDFEGRYVRPALAWWDTYVKTGISPPYDEKKDADILKELRKNNVNPQSDIAELVKEAEQLKGEIDAVIATVADKEKRYKALVEMIKKSAIAQFRPGDKKVSISGSTYNWEISKKSSSSIDKDAMKADGVLDKYTVYGESYAISPKVIKK